MTTVPRTQLRAPPNSTTKKVPKTSNKPETTGSTSASHLPKTTRSTRDDSSSTTLSSSSNKTTPSSGSQATTTLSTMATTDSHGSFSMSISSLVCRTNLSRSRLCRLILVWRTTTTSSRTCLMCSRRALRRISQTPMSSRNSCTRRRVITTRLRLSSLCLRLRHSLRCKTQPCTPTQSRLSLPNPTPLRSKATRRNGPPPLATHTTEFFQTQLSLTKNKFDSNTIGKPLSLSLRDTLFCGRVKFLTYKACLLTALNCHHSLY